MKSTKHKINDKEYFICKKGIIYFSDFYRARDKSLIKGFPAARVVEYELGFAIQYYPSGPYYPELEEKACDGIEFGKHGAIFP